MILRATFENILSFKDETQVSFVAGKSTLHPEHVCRAEKRDDISVLKSGVIYGANASGKSNIIKAIALLQNIAKGRFPKTHIEPFKLSPQKNHTSKIEVEFKQGVKYYAYGVEITLKGISEEWLYEVNSRTDKEVFTRKVNGDGNEFTFGSISGDNETTQFVKFLSSGTPSDISFLSEYIKRNGKGLDAIKQVSSWFLESLKIIFPETRFQGISFRAEKDQSLQTATCQLLKYFNTGIVDVRRFPVKIKEEVNLPSAIINDILSNTKPGNTCAIASPQNNEVYFFDIEENGSYKIYMQKAVHQNSSSEEVVFDMEEESDGSIRLLDFIPMLIDLKQNPVVYLIDEIDRSMHPMLSQKLLECYFSSLSDNRETQLIVSTHESNLLNLELIRADEVWFVEKGEDGASHLTSLSEYKPREDIRKGYLQGRYGAIPFFAPIKTLNW